MKKMTVQLELIAQLLKTLAQQKWGLSVKDNFMKEMTIQLSDITVRQLEAVALKLGISVEDLLQVSVTDKLATLDKDFEAVATYVIEKYAKLYKPVR
ncbi:MAG: hypothetical protein DRR19_05145 [Candidatus Parabeggiatoa sp. nov. 1]|nr:MAG: hypothetical protein DRR19_05145 [Gammaproteobacteria bacterium]